MNQFRDVLLGLLPPVSYARNAPLIRNQAAVDGQALDLVGQGAEQVLNDSDPRFATSLLEWERVLGLSQTDKTYQQRVAKIVAQINAIGGLSIPYFLSISQSLGYVITITEPQPFMAGLSRCGDALAIEDVIYSWWVNVNGGSQQVWLFRAGSSLAGEQLSSYSDTVLETVINNLKPAHTWVGYKYGGS